MARVNRVPRGFTGLLDIKSSGVTPVETAEFLQPNLDLQAYYSATTGYRVSGSTGGVAAVGQGLNIIVPQSEAWLLYCASGELDMAAKTNDDADLSLRVVNIGKVGGGFSNVAFATNQNPNRANRLANGHVVVGWSSSEPMILTGGQGVRVQVDDIEGAFAANILSIEVMYVQVASFAGKPVGTL